MQLITDEELARLTKKSKRSSKKGRKNKSLPKKVPPKKVEKAAPVEEEEVKEAPKKVRVR